MLNRSSYSGTTLSGGMSPNHPRFTPSAIDRLRDFKAPNLTADCLDYRDAPYANGGKLYGSRGDMHEGFNHYELADALHKRDGWILSYNNCEEIRKLYEGYKMIEPKWTYGMNGDKISKELLILNV